MARSARMVFVAAFAAFAKANESGESFKPAELLHEKQDEKAASVTLERLQDEMIHLSGRLDRDQAVSNQMMESLKYDEASKSAGIVSLFETLKRPEHTKIKKEEAEEKTEVRTLMQKTKRRVQEDATQVEDKMEVVRAREPHFVQMPEDIKAEPESIYAVSASVNRLKGKMHSMKVQEQQSKKTGAKIESELKYLEHIRIRNGNSDSKAESSSLAEIVSSPRSLGLLVAVAGCSVAIALVAGIEAMWRRRSMWKVELTVPLVNV